MTWFLIATRRLGDVPPHLQNDFHLLRADRSLHGRGVAEDPGGMPGPPSGARCATGESEDSSPDGPHWLAATVKKGITARGGLKRFGVFLEKAFSQIGNPVPPALARRPSLPCHCSGAVGDPVLP